MFVNMCRFHMKVMIIIKNGRLLIKALENEDVF